MDLSDFFASAALIITAIVGYFNFRKDKKKVDVDAKTAVESTAVAAKESSVRLALQLRDDAFAERKVIKEEFEAFKKSSSEELEKHQQESDRKFAYFQRQIDNFRAELSSTEDTWRNWAFDLHHRWDHHRQNPFPPRLPSRQMRGEYDE